MNKMARNNSNPRCSRNKTQDTITTKSHFPSSPWTDGSLLIAYEMCFYFWTSATGRGCQRQTLIGGHPSVVCFRLCVCLQTNHGVVKGLPWGICSANQISRACHSNQVRVLLGVPEMRSLRVCTYLVRRYESFVLRRCIRRRRIYYSVLRGGC